MAGSDALSRKEATIDTEIGPLAIGLQRFEYDHQHNRHFDTAEMIWLGLDEHDLERSRPVLRETRQMSFVVWTEAQIRSPLLIYLGSPSGPWDGDLSIELKNRELKRGGVRWSTGSEDVNEDVRRIKTNYWCAARAWITLYRDRSSTTEQDAPEPVQTADGAIVDTSVALDYDGDDYQQLYEGVLADLSKQTVRGNLASPLERFVDYQDLKRRQEETPGLELFKRLEGIFPRYKDTLCQILRDPDSKLTLETEHVSLSPNQVDRFLQDRDVNSSVQRVHQVAQATTGQVPTDFTATRSVQTPKTEANRFVAESVQRLKKCVDRLRSHLRAEKRRLELERHESALRRLNEYQEALTRYASLLPYSPDKPTRRFEGRSAVTYYDGRYSRLRQLTSLLDVLMEFVDTSEESIPFEVQAFNKAYEHWCFIKVVDALQEIGFEFVADQGRNVTPFYRNPVPNKVNARMTHPKVPDRILEIWYDREYPVLRSKTDYYPEDRPYGLERRGLAYTDYQGGKRRPDIALEWHRAGRRGVVGRESPRIITLDPTLRTPRPAMQKGDRKPETKYKYRQALRSFVSEGSDGKSEQIVDAAWGISPNLKAGSDTHVQQPSGTDHKYGFILLRPREESLKALRETISWMIKKSGWI